MAREPETPEDRSGITYWNPENVDKMPGRRLASLYANRFHVLVRENTIRIVFGESVVGEDDANWYTAVTFLNADAIAMAQSVLDIARASEAEVLPEQPDSGEKHK